MAENVVAAGRRWIVDTYKESTARAKLHAWLMAHPEATTKDAIAAGLLSVMRALTDSELAKLSKHLSGEAFDIQPVIGAAGAAMLAAIKRIVKKWGGKLLEQEGGLIRWHVQF